MRRVTILVMAGTLAVAGLAGGALGAPLGTQTVYPTPGSFPYWLTAGLDGTIWYTNDGAGDVVGMDSSGSIIRTVHDSSGRRTFAITTTADGRHWFANGSGVGRIDANGDNAVFFPAPGNWLQGITTGPDGNPWFTQLGGRASIGTAAPDGTITSFPADTGFGYGITRGTDGNVWYVDLDRNNAGEYVRVTPSGAITRWQTDQYLTDIAADGQGHMWIVAEQNLPAGNIIKIDMSGNILARYHSPFNGPRQIALGPDGAMWFTMYDDYKIGRIQQNGTIQSWDAYPGGPGRRPFDIVWGPDGDMWYTMDQAIGRIGTGSTTAPPPPPGVSGQPAPGGGSSPVAEPVASPIGGSPGCAAPPAGPVGMTINGGDDYTNDPRVRINVVWPACTATVSLANDGGFRRSETRDVAATIPWVLRTSGPERLPKTVYLRFGSNSQNYTDDIILDQSAPQIVSATATVAQGQAAMAMTRRTAGRSVIVTVQARDRGGSGPGSVRVQAGRASATGAYGKRVVIRTARASVRVRVRDRAGNWSRVRIVRVR